MKNAIRIGNAGGYWGDDLGALRRQLEGGHLDYITLDFLAEITMSILQKQRTKNPELGYANDFVGQIRDSLPELVKSGTRVITNAGGINPIGLGRRLHALVKEAGAQIKIGVVAGDDILPRLDEFTTSGESFTNMETGENFSPIRSRITSANVYFGAEGVVEALKEGCQIIVTGRVTDTGITLAPMIHEFGWSLDDWDKLAAGIVAGHIIECGAQASGGNLTDWQEVRSFHDIGYPIIEMRANGEFIVTKHPKTGGKVSLKSVKEQLVYEMGDPTRYIAPDAVARFSSIQLNELGNDRVHVYGITGAPAPELLKVSMSYDDGYKASGELLVSGPNTAAKSKAFAKVFWERLNLKFEATRTEEIGVGSIWPTVLSNYEPIEILLRFGVRDQDEKKVEAFGRLLPSMILSGPSGVAVTGGRPKPTPVVAYWPTLMKRDKLSAKVTVIDSAGKESTKEISLKRTDTSSVIEAPVRPKSKVTFAFTGMAKKGILRDLAYARSGDKGDTCNIGVLARSPMAYAWLKKELTQNKVRQFFKGICKGKVIRFELDNLEALNFLLEETLGGGGTRSLMIDPQGKTLSQALLQMPLQIPGSVLKSVGKK